MGRERVIESGGRGERGEMMGKKGGVPKLGILRNTANERERGTGRREKVCRELVK